MTSLSLQRLGTNRAFVLRILNLLMPAAMAEHREYKRAMLRDTHRYWEIETPYDHE